MLQQEFEKVEEELGQTTICLIRFAFTYFKFAKAKIFFAKANLYFAKAYFLHHNLPSADFYKS